MAKKNKKTSEIIALSNLTIVGNKFLYKYAKQYNDNVAIVPTSIDTNYHIPTKNKKNNAVCIGWTGSSTTLKHFEEILPVLIKIKEKYKNKVVFKLIVDKKYCLSELDLTSTPWSKETEVSELNKIDIGIMPLPNDKWSKGKCGFKGLQYMALEKPAVMSPVGVNTEIINNGVNGFLADSNKEWFDVLEKLINSETLRTEIGKNGRQTVVEKYSLNKQKEILLEWFEKTI